MHLCHLPIAFPMACVKPGERLCLENHKSPCTEKALFSGSVVYETTVHPAEDWGGVYKSYGCLRRNSLSTISLV